MEIKFISCFGISSHLPFLIKNKKRTEAIIQIYKRFYKELDFNRSVYVAATYILMYML